MGLGLFATNARSVSLRLVDAPLPDGRLGVRLEGHWSESFDFYRWAVRTWHRQPPATTKWPTTILDEEP